MCARGWWAFHKKGEKKTNRQIEWNFPRDCIFLLISLFFDNRENRSCRPHVSLFRSSPCKSYLLLPLEIVHELDKNWLHPSSLETISLSRVQQRKWRFIFEKLLFFSRKKRNACLLVMKVPFISKQYKISNNLFEIMYIQLISKLVTFLLQQQQKN